jgi:hypothetical protein
MAEGEVPEIARHLEESVKSAEVYEQEARREFQIAEKAWQLRIPKETMAENEGVRRYVGILRDLEVTLERLNYSRLPAEDPIAPEGSDREDRDFQVGSLHYAGKVILEDGFPGSVDVIAHLRGSLNDVSQRYGARVEDGDEEDFPDSIAASGVWSRKHSEVPPEVPWPDRQRRSSEARRWWVLTDMPGERHDCEHLAELAEEAQRQGLRSDVTQTDPVAHALLARLVHARQLATEISAVGQLQPPPGLAPSAAERLARIEPLAHLAVDVLEEEFRPGQLSPRRVMASLTDVGRAYGLTVRSR